MTKLELTENFKNFYLSIKSERIRKVLFSGYCWLVNTKKVKGQIGGINYDLDLGEIIDLCIYLNRYEQDVTAAILKYCKPGMTVVDIGANVGAHALTFAKIAGSNGRVIAFEPTEYAFKKLSVNIALNPTLKIEPVQLALWSSQENSVQINYRSSWRTNGQRHDYPCFVGFETLDKWTMAHDIDKIDLIKIDVDGNEFPIFCGAVENIKKSRPIILMEVVGPHFKDRSKNPLLILSNLGYRFFRVSNEDELSLDDFELILNVDDIEMTNSMNIVARPSK